METIIIDEKFENIIKKEFWYEYNDDLKFEGNIEIKLNLIVTGNISSEGDISSEGYIYSKGDISSEGNISSEGYISSEGNIYSGRELRGKIKKVCGIETKKYIEIHSYWIIRIMDNYMKIGCCLKTKKEWAKITKREAIEMGDKDLVIWKMKKWLLSI